MGGPQADPLQDAGCVRRGRNRHAVFDTALDEDPEQQVIAEPEMQDAPPKVGMVAHNARNRKQPKKCVSRMQGNKYQVALTQVGTSKMLMASAQMYIKKALEMLKATLKNGVKKLKSLSKKRSIEETLIGSSPCRVSVMTAVIL